MNKIILTITIVILVLVGYLAINKTNPLGASLALNAYDTTSGGFTIATSTVNTTSTQVFASIARLNYIINNTTALFTCSLDAVGITAVSSTVTAGRGVLIYPSSTIAFGECRSQQNCFPHKGTVNCLGSAAGTIDTLVQ